MCEKRKTSARHLHNHRGLPFPFGLQLDADERGAPCLRPSNPKHGASRMMSRLSVLLMRGPSAADELARTADLPVEEVRELCACSASPGKSCAHLDVNDTGAGHRRHSYIPWGSKGEVAYIYGDEGLKGPIIRWAPVQMQRQGEWQHTQRAARGTEGQATHLGGM